MPIILFVAAYLVKMAYLYVVHFPLASIEIEDVNPWFEMVKIWLVPISWIPASFMATSISGGESKVKEITFTSAISLTPYILINIPLMFLSNHQLILCAFYIPQNLNNMNQHILEV